MIENLGTQAESNRTLAGNLIEQQRKQQEASRTLARESVDAYMEFLGSVFAFPARRRVLPSRPPSLTRTLNPVKKRMPRRMTPPTTR